MLADLLEKKSNPPVQVVQMGQQINAPTIQITETGQIVQVKTENNPLIQINSEGIQPSAPFFQIKNDQGQLIQIKNDQGQIIQLKSDQLQGMIQFKNDQGQIVQIKNDGQNVAQMIQPSVIQAVKTDKDQIVETVVTDHSYTEPPAKKLKIEEKPENNSPQESVSKTAANLYAALAASALEDEDDLLPPKQDAEIIPSVLVAGSSDSQSVIIQEPILQVQQPTMQVQQPTIQVQQPMQVQQPTLQMQASTIQVQQPTLQVQQPMLQVQPMDVQNIIASQSGQLILQEKPVTSQTTQFMQQPMQIIATQGTSQAGLSYIAQNIPGNMMQKTIIIVQGPTGGGPLTLTNAPQITPSQQPIITTQPQPHKAQLVNQAPTQQIVVTQKQPPALISTSSGNPIVGTNQIIQGNQQLLQGNQQIIAVSNNQQIIVNTPMKQGVVQHRVVQQPQRSQITTVAISNNQTSTTMSESKTVPIQGGTKSQQPIIRQVITRQPVMMGNTKIGDKEVLVTQPVAEKQAVPKKTVTPPPQPLPPGAEDTPWICHWRGCGKSFGGAGAVFAHAARAHCPAGAGGEAACQWLDCDRVPRRTFALLNHLTDKHCTPQALKAVYNSRRHTVAESEASKPVSLGYPPNAALAALNKHATDMFNPRELMHRADVSRTPDLMDENEGPVTKSIRLTAALILRNIVIYSNTGRRLLRSYEAHLASIALSNVEASRTIAQVLYDMNNI
nr:AT-rich interactive domain-containing protein 2-like isoform X7 [Vanessa tameamea]